MGVRSCTQYTYFSLVVIFYLSSVFIYWPESLFAHALFCEYMVYILYLLLERTFVGAKRYRKSLSPSYETIYYIIWSNAYVIYSGYCFVVTKVWNIFGDGFWSPCPYRRYTCRSCTQIIIICCVSPVSGGRGRDKESKKKEG